MAMRRPNPSRASLPDARVSGRRHHCAGWRKWLPAHSPGLEAWREGFSQFRNNESLKNIYDLFHMVFGDMIWGFRLLRCASWHGSRGDMIVVDGSDIQMHEYTGRVQKTLIWTNLPQGPQQPTRSGRNDCVRQLGLKSEAGWKILSDSPGICARAQMVTGCLTEEALESGPNTTFTPADRRW